MLQRFDVFRSRLRVGVLFGIALISTACATAESNSFTIIHLNDLHARLLPDDNGLGGFAHVATAIRRERANARNPLVLHAGDMVQGTPVSTIFEGVPAYEVGNHLGIDVYCLGNHEFDYGWRKIRDFVEASDSPIVNANVLNGDGERLLDPYVIRTVGDIKVAVVGAVMDNLPRLLKPGLTGPWVARPLVETLRPVVDEAQSEADLVVVLGHLFNDQEENLLRELPDIDILIGGHNHGGRDTPLVIDGRVCVGLRSYGREIGKLEIEFDPQLGRVTNHKWQRITVDSRTFEADPATLLEVEDWESRVSEIVDVDIGESTATLRKPGLKHAIERAMIAATGADLAYMNSGGIRDSMPAGPLLARTIWNILPFDNEVVEAIMRGSEVPPEVAKGLAPRRLYRVVTNDFVAGQWSDRGLEFKPTGHTLRDVFLDWVKERKTIP